MARDLEKAMFDAAREQLAAFSDRLRWFTSIRNISVGMGLRDFFPTEWIESPPIP